MAFQVFLLFFLLAVTCSLTVLIRKSFEESVPLVFFGIVLVLFLFGLVNLLGIGVYIVLGLGATLTAVAVVLLFSKRRKIRISDCVRNMITPAAVLFVLLYIALSFFNRGRVMYNWDELSHWGSIVKAMLQNNNLGLMPETQCIYPSYPPGMALLQYFVLKTNTFFDGEIFSEWRLFFSYQIFGYVVLLPFLRGLSFRKPIGAIIRISIILLLPQFFLNCFFQRIYIDSFLGILFGAMLAYACFMEIHSFRDEVPLLMGCAMLVLTKEVGGYFGLIVVMCFTCKYLHKEKKAVCRRKTWLTHVIICWIALVFPYVLWKIKIYSSNCFIAFQERIDILEYLRVITGVTQGDKRSMWIFYLQNLLTPVFPVKNFGINTTPLICFIATIGCFFVSKKAKEYSINEYDNNLSAEIVIISIGVLFYLFGLGAVYLYRIPDASVSSLPSFSRYISPFLMGIIICAGLGVVLATNYRKNSIAALFIILVLIFAPQSGIVDFISGKYTDESIKRRESLQGIADKVLTYAGDERLNVFVLDQGGPGWAFWYYHMLLMPSHVLNHSINDNEGQGWSIGSRTEGGIDISPEDLQAVLMDRYDILIVDAVDEAFVEDYGALFAEPEDIHNGTIFIVNRAKGLLELLE